MSVRIFSHGKQFFDAAELAFNGGNIAALPHATVCNYCFFIELAFKSLSPIFYKANYDVPQDVAHKSSLHGHDLARLLNGIDDNFKVIFTSTYSGRLAFNLDINEISKYFESARYGFEPDNARSYDISLARNLAKHVLSCIEKNSNLIDAHIQRMKLNFRAAQQ